MAELSTSNLLWYIYKRNLSVGRPTAILMPDFCAEFSSATKEQIENELRNLIEEMKFISNKSCCLYDLTEAGLEEVERLKATVK